MSARLGIRTLMRQIREEVAFHGRPGLRGTLGALLFNLNLQLMVAYRIRRYLTLKTGWRCSLVQALLEYWQTSVAGCQISPHAEIGPRLVLPHPLGVVVGRGCRLGPDVTLYQHVTLGEGKDGGYPTLEDGVTVYPNSVVAGGITLGRGSRVGALSFVTRDVGANETVAGIPAQSTHRPSTSGPGGTDAA